MDCTRNFNTSGYRLVSVERGKNLRYGDEEYQKKLNFISTIPSNKIDTDNLKNISDEDMSAFNEKHLRDLREQVMGYDEQELAVVADAITERGWTYSYNALGEYFDKMYRQREATKVINQ